MREITEHHTNDVNKAILLQADDPDPDNGNASHRYLAKWYGAPDEQGTPQGRKLDIQFQQGPIGEVGVNGVTNEVLLCIVADRLRGFQSSKFACSENADALEAVEEALATLESRTKGREARGVEGTHQK